MQTYDGNTTIISTIGTNPAERGLTTDEFKAKFDEGLKAFVEWFNDEHKTEFEAVQTGLSEHKAETVSQVAEISRDISIAGVQTIALPFKAKSIIILASVWGTKMTSNGMWSQNFLARSTTCEATTGVFKGKAWAIHLGTDASNYAKATIQNVTATGFELLWEIVGTVTGTANIYFQANTH
jgi:hypothetical protein